MIALKTLASPLLLFTFSFQLVFADVTHENPVLLPKTEEKGEEILDEEIAPPPPPALIDLDVNQNKPPVTTKWSSLGLFLVNTLMFTAGMIVVKTLPAKEVESS